MATYCSISDVNHYIGYANMAMATTGDATAVQPDSDMVSFAINFADSTIDSSLVAMYDLTISHAGPVDWLRHTSAILACVWIFRQAQNGTIPPGLQTFYDERMEALNEIKEGQRQIPGLAVKADPGVSMSNVHHDPRWPTRKLRTTPWNNTGDQNSTQVRNLDLFQPFE